MVGSGDTTNLGWELFQPLGTHSLSVLIRYFRNLRAISDRYFALILCNRRLLDRRLGEERVLHDLERGETLSLLLRAAHALSVLERWDRNGSARDPHTRNLMLRNQRHNTTVAVHFVPQTAAFSFSFKFAPCLDTP